MSRFRHLAAALAVAALLAPCRPTQAVGASPRRVRIDGQRFVLAATNETIVMSGPNVVVKGPPYLPGVTGSTHCEDYVNDTCTATGTCVSCFTFNEADVALLKSQHRNTIRLGVVWAGAQPRDEDALDPDFLRRLHAILNLTDRTGIHVVLDNHGDMVGTAGCGNGAPVWFQQKAAPELIGKPLVTGFPFSLVPSLRIDKTAGYERCGDNATAWAMHAGDPNYNLLNDCCLAMNSPNPGGLGYTTISQKTMNYMVEPGPGRDDFVRYWSLMAEAVREHPSAFAAELMNEPMSINRRDMYDTWRAVTEAVNAVVPDMSVAVCDTGEGAVLPGWVYDLLDKVPLPYLAPSEDTVKWMRQATTIFYAWHWYGSPSTPEKAIQSVHEVMKDWNVPSFATEFGSCDAWNACAAANISHTYWHYSSYCNTGPSFGNRSVPTDTFGGCMLGWAGGYPDSCM